MQIVSVTVPSKHQITRINELELTFLNSKQKNHIPYNTQPNLTIIYTIIKRMRYIPNAWCP